MRPVLTLDDDVVLMLDHLAALSSVEYQKLVNNLLRESLRRATESGSLRIQYRTPSSDAGECLAGSVADIEQVLADFEGPARR